MWTVWGSFPFENHLVLMDGCMRVGVYTHMRVFVPVYMLSIRI